MKKSDVLKSITSNLEKHPTLGVSRFKNERASIKKKIDNLHGVIEGLDNALKDSALKQKENFTEMLEEILEQKKQCTNDILLFKNKLASLDEKEKNFKVALRGEKFKDYIKLLLSNLKKLDSLEFKSLIRILIPKAIIHLGEAENKLELIYNLDVKTPPVRQTGGMEVFLHGQDGVIPLFPNPSYSEQIKGGEQEDKKWPYIKSGRADWIRTSDHTPPRRVRYPCATARIFKIYPIHLLFYLIFRFFIIFPRVLQFCWIIRIDLILITIGAIGTSGLATRGVIGRICLHKDSVKERNVI